MKRKLSNAWLLSAAVMLLPLSGCLHPRLDRGEELLSHPQFEAAANAAPQWVTDALDIIVELEAEVERK